MDVFLSSCSLQHFTAIVMLRTNDRHEYGITQNNSVLFILDSWCLDDLFEPLLEHDDRKQLGVATFAEHFDFLMPLFDRHLLPFSG